MEFGFHTVHFSPMFGVSVPLLEVVRATGAAGFHTLGFDLASIDAHCAAGGSLQAVAELAAAADLRCSDVLALVVGGDDSDTIATAKRLGHIGSTLGAETCVAALGGPVPRATLVPLLRECARVLGDHGLTLSIEFVPYTPLPTLRAATDLCASVGWDSICLVIDSLHFFRSGTPVEQVAQIPPDRIALVQFADAPSARPRSLRHESRSGRLVPGHGALPLTELVDLLVTGGFDGTVVAEVLSEKVRAESPVYVCQQVARAISTFLR